MMTEIYSGGKNKKYTRSQIRKMLKKMKKSYSYIPYYKNKAEEDHQKESLDADKMLDYVRNDDIEKN